ncbi:MULTISPECIES: efflux transporter outer membrane subunit [unclassified Sphingomonas]|uniref:efflux transporter outer membrane subunit n=1 Tax=Sphingomonas TaxID=13687 RepID=UPI0009672C9E|nr:MULTISPECIES: efflux transporter outer membrane subunit [unclassified Sphingomonas]MBN8810854.1 efflux transporter outer membrane subunit [Sphingomonas sp.]OJY49262.1 MAG: RND transporter [Sphingomonas sp. 67-41]
MTRTRPLLAMPALAAALLSGCNLAPPYARPGIATVPASFKEAPGWRPATPSDALAKGEWWTMFGDPVLDDLERRVIVSNQNLAAAKATYDAARALVREQRAAALPTVSLQTNANDSGGLAANSSIKPAGSIQLGLQASWEPDLWGKIGNTVSQARAQAQASAADLANATLSAQAELALDYVQLRGIEAQKAALDATVVDYERALTITTNLYNAGVSARADVLQAETALRNARGDAADLVRQRALLEHAIAVLVGENPSSFSIAPAATWNRAVPEVPAILPAELLERRPDIASAERGVAAANANIGVQRAAFFPTIGLTGQIGQQSSALGALFGVASSAWSLGLTGALTLLDFGARTAKVDQARAQYAQTVASYRQAVLTAFQQVEDQLAAVRVLDTVATERAAAATAANAAERIARNQYGAGTVAYSSVIVAQNTALAARNTDILAVVNRQVAAVSLVQAIGGGWHAPDPGVPLPR